MFSFISISLKCCNPRSQPGSVDCYVVRVTQQEQGYGGNQRPHATGCTVIRAVGLSFMLPSQ